MDEIVSYTQHPFKPKDAFSSYWLPGYQPQGDYVLNKKPNVVTISIGGNDIGFSRIIKGCVLGAGTCYSTYEERKGLIEDIDGNFNRLETAYNYLKARSSPGAYVYVIGYPQVVQTDGNCGLNVHLNKGETEFANELIDYFDHVIQEAAARAGVVYVDTENSLNGHRLCGSQTPPFAVNGLTAGNDNYIIGNESYHPTAYGYELMAAAIMRDTNNFTKPMPAPDRTVPDLSAYPDDDLNALTFLDGVPKSGGTVRKQEFDNSSKDVSIITNDQVSSDLSGSDNSLKSNENYDVWRHSDPVKLGTVKTDANGNLHYSFQLPPDTNPGFHTIDIYGEDTSDTPIDIKRLIYVAASADDWDGDGVPNNKEPCGVFESSSIDEDHDGVDDACDPIIGNNYSGMTSSGMTSNTVQNSMIPVLLHSGDGSVSVSQTLPNTESMRLSAPWNVVEPGNDQSVGQKHGATSKKLKDSGKWLIVVCIIIALAILAYIAIKRRLFMRLKT